METKAEMTPAEANRFERDTAVRRITDMLWHAELATGWAIHGVPNGGYVMSVAARVLSQALPHPDPLTISGYYLAPTTPGPISLRFESLREGRSVSTGAVQLIQEGRECARFLATHADLCALEGPSFIEDGPPPTPPAHECVENPIGIEINDRLELRLPPDETGWARGQMADRAELTGWVRLREGGRTNPLSLLLFADAFPPAVYTRFGAKSWVPTLELTVQLRGRPAPGFVLGRFRTRYLIDGQLEEDGELWDGRGRLVALSRQLARMRLQG